MSDSSRKPLRCLAALLLFLVIGILAYLAVVEPLQRQSLDLDTDIERITGQIDRYQGLLRTQAELSRAVEVLKTTHEQDLYFSDKSPTQVATELQGLCVPWPATREPTSCAAVRELLKTPKDRQP